MEINYLSRLDLASVSPNPCTVIPVSVQALVGSAAGHTLT